MKQPLEGIRVLDLTQAYSDPFCTMNLADHGAEVIKIETPEKGDQTRGWGPMENGYSGYYAYINRNKKGITLNLKTEEGKQIFTELLKTADVVCENYKVGVLERLGFSYEKMKAINPGIIYGSISGFGLSGDLASRPAYDIVAQAMSGMMSVTGFPDGAPCKIGPSIGDNYTGAYLCMGVLMALYEREKTGAGRRIDIAMMDTLFSVMENFVVEYTIAGKTPHRAGNQDPSIAPFDSFRAKDGDFVMGCGTDKMYASLCGAMGREDLAKDPRFLTNLDRCENYGALKPLIEAWTTTKTVKELEKIISGLSIPFGEILNIPQAAEHPQTKERNMLWNVYQSGMERTIRIPGTPIKIHGEADEPRKAAPLLGEDNASVFGELGYDAASVEDLENQYAEGQLLLERLEMGHNLLGGDKNRWSTESICVEEIPVSPVLFTRRTQTNYKNSDVSVERWFELFEIVQRQKLRATGSVVLTYHNNPLEQFYQRDCDLEICIQVNEAVAAPAAKTFGGFTAVTALHVGRNEDIIQTHIKAIKWLNQQGYTIAGPVSEEYIISPVDITNEEDHITKVIIPIEKPETGKSTV